MEIRGGFFPQGTIRHGLIVFIPILALMHSVVAQELAIYPDPKQDRTIEAALNADKIITCKAGNVERPELLKNFQWFLGDKNVNDLNNNHLSLQPLEEPLSPGLALYFTSIRNHDLGTYVCRAEYANQQVEANFTLKSIIPIKFVDANKDQYATLNEEFTIKCVVESNPGHKIVWKKDSVMIKSDSDIYLPLAKGLVIKNVSLTDEAVYTCQASVVETGEVQRRDIILQVNEKPSIVSNLQDTDGVEGESKHLRCEATGKPSPTITWIHRGKVLEELPRFTVDKYKGTLQIDDLQFEDRGEYTCEAQNQAGQVSVSFELNVITKPTFIEYNNVTTQVEGVATLICSARGYPAPDISFHKDSSKSPFVNGAQSDIRIHQSQTKLDDKTTATLTIKNILRTDDGLYNCIATNGRIQAEKVGHLTVQFPPTFESTPMTKAFSWDRNPAVLTCIAEAIPNATIEWFFGGTNRAVVPSRSFKIEGRESISNLTIYPIDGSEFGVYSCIGTNSLSRATHSIEFLRADLPGPIQQVIIHELHSTTVSFKLAPPLNDGGFPIESYSVQFKAERERWGSEGVENRTWPLDESIITVENLEPLRSYSFRFAAQSKVGTGRWTEDVLVTMLRRAAPGSPPFKTEILNGVGWTNSDRMELSWSLPPNNGEPIDKFELTYIPVRNVSGGRWEEYGSSEDKILLPHQLSYVMLNLYSNTFYKVEIKAHNSIGWGTPSHLIIKTAPLNDGFSPVKRAGESVQLSTPLIIIIAATVFLLILIIIDVICCRLNNKGVFYFIFNGFCGKKKTLNGSIKGSCEKQPIPDFEKLDRFHNLNDLDDIPATNVSQPLITNNSSNGKDNLNGGNSSPGTAHTLV